MPLARNRRGIWGAILVVTKGAAEHPDEAAPVRVGLLHGLSRQAYQLCLSRDIDRRIIQLRRRSAEKVELVAVGQAGERADPLSQTLVHIATRGEKWFSLLNHECQQLIKALKRNG